MDHPDTQEPDTKKDATAEPTAQAKEPKEPKEPPAAAKPEKKDDRDDRIAALEAEIASMKAAKDEAEAAAAKKTILSARGIGDAYAAFLTGDKDTWETQADALAALKGADPAPTTVPRDPAVDGDTTDNDEDLAAAKAFLGID